MLHRYYAMADRAKRVLQLLLCTNHYPTAPLATLVICDISYLRQHLLQPVSQFYYLRSIATYSLRAEIWLWHGIYASLRLSHITTAMCSRAKLVSPGQ